MCLLYAAAMRYIATVEAATAAVAAATGAWWFLLGHLTIALFPVIGAAVLSTALLSKLVRRRSEVGHCDAGTVTACTTCT